MKKEKADDESQEDRKKPVGGDNHYEAGRVPTKFYYTYQDIAVAKGCPVKTVRRHVREGTIDPNNLASLLNYLS